MNPRHPQSQYLEGPVRQLQPGQWNQDREQARTMDRQFTAAGGMVPTNIQNYLSVQPAPSQFGYDLISKGLVPQVSPYGDGRRVEVPETAVLTTPGPAMPQVPPPVRGAELQVNTPGYGFGPGSPLNRIDAAQRYNAPLPPPLGMSTSPNVAASGPQRDVPKPA